MVAKNFFVAVGLISMVACAHQMIEGTQIPETSENREIMDMLRKLQEGMRALDANAILSMVSTSYFEDNGTPDSSDDYGYAELSTRILPDSLEVAKEMYVSFVVHDIVVTGEHAYADIRYSSRARLELPSGTLWDSHREFNRLVFAREKDAWRIVSGL